MWWWWAVVVVFLVRDLRCNSYVVTLLVLKLMWINLMLDLI